MRAIETTSAELGADVALGLGCVGNVESAVDLAGCARDLVARARHSAYLAALPATLSSLLPALQAALGRGVCMVVFTTRHFDLPGARVVVSAPAKQDRRQRCAPRTILVVDGAEALVGEQLGPGRVHGCWTQSPLLVSIIEHYLLRSGQRRFLVVGRS